MSSNVTVTIDAKDTLNFLKRLKKNTPKVAKKITFDVAKSLKRRIRANIRNRVGKKWTGNTGRLYSSAEAHKTGKGATVIVGKGIDYARIVEEGSRRHTISKNPLGYTWRTETYMNYFGPHTHPGHKGAHFVRDAQKTLDKDMNKIINRSLDRLLK